MVVMNCLFALKEPGGGSNLYLKLCDKDDLNEDLKFNTATQNDSKQMFFKVRKEAVNLLRLKIHEFMRNKTSLCVSLDKVTLHGRSYTVIISFVFHQGRLVYFLNEMFVMSSGKQKYLNILKGVDAWLV